MRKRRTQVYLFLLTLITQSSLITADSFVQTLECSEDLQLIEKSMKDGNNQEVILSQSKFSPDNAYYQQNCDNALTLIGKNDYQFDVTLQWINMRPPTDGICTDYLKLYDAPRVDNSMLLTPLEGLCGSSLPMKRAFKTNRNYITIRLKTGLSMDISRYEGFSILVTQSPWSSPGNSKGPGFNPGGWNDGFSSSFQWTWNLQVRVPGSLRRPGQELEKSPSGIDCVDCYGCSVHQFELDRDAYSLRKGCFMCAKIWNNDYASGQRSCYSERGFMSLLKSFGDPTIDLSTRDGLFHQIGCHQYFDQYGQKLSYCFCNEPSCNKAASNFQNQTILFFVFVFNLFYQLF